MLPVLWEAGASWRDASASGELRRALVAWLLLSANLTPLWHQGAQGAPGALASFLAAWLALDQARAHWPGLAGPASPRRRLVCYALWIGLPLLLVRGCESHPPPTPNLISTLPAKLRYYEEHRDEFELLLVGDSRTLCAAHPERLDPLLGLRSLNLAMWAHWLPTQYPFFLDLVPQLREDVRVVWFVGHQNLLSIEPINGQYPIPLAEAPLYLSLGFSWADLRPNLIEHSPLGAPLRPLLGWTSALRASADSFATRTLYPRASAAADPYAIRAQRLIEELQRDPATLKAAPVLHEGRVTSLAVQRRGGGYLRYELDPAFFRAKQAEPRPPPPPGPLRADPGRLALFERILALCARAQVRLIVCEIEEAPHVYGSPEVRERYRRFMRERIQPLVEARGFAYARPDWDPLSDAHYFDYNHLNHEGVERASPLIASALAPHLDEPRRGPR